MKRAAAIALTLAALPGTALARDGDAERLLAGRTAGPMRDCITPDLAVQPVIVEGRGLIYRDSRTTYFGTFTRGCAELKRGRIVVTRGAGHRLCRNDPARISDPTGAGYGFCTFEGFTPYVKGKG